MKITDTVAIEVEASDSAAAVSPLLVRGRTSNSRRLINESTNSENEAIDEKIIFKKSHFNNEDQGLLNISSMQSAATH